MIFYDFIVLFILSYKNGVLELKRSDERRYDRMKYLKEVAIIFGITMAGEFLNYLLPLPVPAGVYGLFILLLLLCAGTLKVEDVSEVGDFFLDTMPLMFIPAGVGLLNSVDEAKSILVPLTVISVVSTVLSWR